MMVTISRVNWILPRYTLSVIHQNRCLWRCFQARCLARKIIILTIAGCGALTILPLTRQFTSQRSFLHRRYHHYSGTNEILSRPLGSHPTRWTDVLPSDLDVLGDAHVIGTVGAQILRFAGWTKKGTTWVKPNASTSLTLQDRLERITPTWKAGGTIDYSFDGPGIFSEALETGATIEQLGQTIESMGLLPNDLDYAAQKALRTMLSWSIPDDSSPNNSNHVRSSRHNKNNQHLVLMVFSFDATPFCWDVSNCPQPGPSNQLLAATVLQFLLENATKQAPKNIHVMTQWEVAAAIEQQRTTDQKYDVIPVGMPGTFQNTAEIFSLMMCELNELISGEKLDFSLLNAILLAHPDHLRRVFWTAQTILRSKQSCTIPQLSITTALMPYDLMWPVVRETTIQSRNLFRDVPLTSVNSMGMKKMTNWYDKKHLGYFLDGDPQFWTHQREVWILYDHWAVLKGIVTGTIQPEEMVNSAS